MLERLISALSVDGRTEARGAEVFVTALRKYGFDFEDYSTVRLFGAIEVIGYDLADINCFNIATLIDSKMVKC